MKGKERCEGEDRRLRGEIEEVSDMLHRFWKQSLAEYKSRFEREKRGKPRKDNLEGERYEGRKRGLRGEIQEVSGVVHGFRRRQSVAEYKTFLSVIPSSLYSSSSYTCYRI